MTEKSDETVRGYENLIRYVVASLLEEGTEIDVQGRVADGQIRLEVHVPKKERGRVIGRGGRIARAMRTLLAMAELSTNRPVVLNIVD